MSFTFTYAGHHDEIQNIMDRLERLEANCYQIERMFWDTANNDWLLRNKVDHSAKQIAQSLCPPIMDICQDIMSRLAKLCFVYDQQGLWGVAGQWNSKQAIYAGGKYLDEKLDTLGGAVDTGDVPLTINIASITTRPAVDADQLNLIPNAIGVVDALKRYLFWYQNWLWNMYRRNVMMKYESMFTQFLALCRRTILDNLGAQFATPITAYYSDFDTDTVYLEPRIEVATPAAQTLRLRCINNSVNNAAVYSCPQTGDSGFDLVKVGDTLHLAKLDIPGYELFADRLYTVAAVDSGSLTLDIKSDITLPTIVSAPAAKFGDLFIIRKLREL